MFLSRLRACAEPEANAASVPTLTSRGLDVGPERRDTLATVPLAVRFAGVDLLVVAFLAVAVLVTFDGLLARTGRSLMACTSLSSSDSPDTKACRTTLWRVRHRPSGGRRRFKPLVRREHQFPRLPGWFHRHT